MDIRQEMLDEFREELSTTQRILERIPEDKLAWQPQPTSMVLGQLAMHLASLPGNVVKITRDYSFDLAARNREVSLPKEMAEVLAVFEQSAHDVETAFMETSEDHAKGLWRIMRGEREVLARSRYKIWRAFLLNHRYHHRGQLTVYLRLLDLPSPSVYGASADGQPF